MTLVKEKFQPTSKQVIKTGFGALFGFGFIA
jgi:hypothetical protein